MDYDDAREAAEAAEMYQDKMDEKVARLTKERAELLAITDELVELVRVSDMDWGSEEADRYDRVATRLAALSLPTPEA